MTIAEKFTTDVDTAKIEQMAKMIAIEDDAIATMSEQLSERKKNLEQLKIDLAELMIQSGMKNCKLECGLTPTAKIVTKFFKAQGVDDETLFKWLTDNGLGGIIKPSVHWGTLNTTIKEYVDSFGEVPEIIQQSDTPTIIMNGKSKFLAARNQ